MTDAAITWATWLLRALLALAIVGGAVTCLRGAM